MTNPSLLTSILEIHHVSMGARHALFGLISFRNKTSGLCCPSIDRLAERLGVPYGTVRHWLRELRRAGVVRATKHRGSNSYQLEFPTSVENTVDKRKNAHRERPTVDGQERPTVDAPLEQTVFNWEGGVDSTVLLAAPVVQNRPTPPLDEIARTPTQTQTQTQRKPPGRAETPGSTQVEEQSTQVETGSAQIERRPPARAQVSDEIGQLKFFKVRDSLRELAGVVRLPPPDDDLVRMVIRAARGATGDEIHATLVALWKADAFERMRGWGFVPVKIRDCFGEGCDAQKTG